MYAVKILISRTGQHLQHFRRLAGGPGDGSPAGQPRRLGDRHHLRQGALQLQPALWMGDTD